MDRRLARRLPGRPAAALREGRTVAATSTVTSPPSCRRTRDCPNRSSAIWWRRRRAWRSPSAVSSSCVAATASARFVRPWCRCTSGARRWLGRRLATLPPGTIRGRGPDRRRRRGRRSVSDQGGGHDHARRDGLRLHRLARAGGRASEHHLERAGLGGAHDLQGGDRSQLSRHRTAGSARCGSSAPRARSSPPSGRPPWPRTSRATEPASDLVWKALVVRCCPSGSRRGASSRCARRRSRPRIRTPVRTRCW